MTNPHQEETFTELYKLIKQSNYTVVLTGAGMSTECGLPDFRSPSGWWKNIDPLTVATVEALETNYDLFHEFYCARIKALENCHPHEGHYILTKWQQNGHIQRVVTQNVDGLHTQAQTTHVAELHGSILIYSCHDCGNEASKHQFLSKENCSLCNGKLRPNVVLFGENLPQLAWNNALHHIQLAELVIVIGSSLQVYPVSQLPKMTNGKTIYINMEMNEKQSFFDLVIEGSARDTLIEVDRLLK